MLRAPIWALCCLLAADVGLLGCATSCEKENAEPLLYLGGRTSPNCMSYQTNGVDANGVDTGVGQGYVNFPPGRRLRIPHGLGQEPILLKSYVAFVPEPLPQDENGNTAESAGNQVIIEGWNDEFVQVRNDTCEFFFLRLVLLVDEPHPSCLGADGASGAAGAGGAGGVDGAAGAGG